MGFKRWVWLLWLVVLLLLVWVVRQVPLTAVGPLLTQLTWAQLGLLLLLNGLVLLTMVGRWWLLLGGLGQWRPLLPLLGYRLAAFGVSFFTPGPQFGGEPVQVLLVEKRAGVVRETAVASVTLDKTVELMVNFTFLAIGGLLLLDGAEGEMSATAVGGAGVLLLCPPLYLAGLWRGRQPIAALMAAPLAVPTQDNPYARAVAGMRRSEQAAGALCQRSPGWVVAAWLITMAGWWLLLWEYGLLLRFVGADLNWREVAAVYTAVRFSLLLPLPGGLGSMEAAQLVMLTALGNEPVVGIAATVLMRSRDVLLGVVGLGCLWVAGRQTAVRG